MSVVKEGSFVESNALTRKSFSGSGSVLVIENKSFSSGETTEGESDKEEENRIVRPPAAGTKEQPDYQFDKDTLKAKMAMFQKESTNEYKPRNQIKKDEKKVAAEIVNKKTNDENEEKEEFVTSIDQKAARSVFENPKKESTPAPKTVNDIVPASNLNAAKGVFSNKTVESFDLQLSPKEEEKEVIEDVTEKVSEQLENTEVVNVPDEKAIEQDTSSPSSDSSSEADSLEAKQEEVVQEETTENLQAEEASEEQNFDLGNLSIEKNQTNPPLKINEEKLNLTPSFDLGNFTLEPLPENNTRVFSAEAKSENAKQTENNNLSTNINLDPIDITFQNPNNNNSLPNNETKNSSFQSIEKVNLNKDFKKTDSTSNLGFDEDKKTVNEFKLESSSTELNYQNNFTTESSLGLTEKVTPS